MPDTISPLPEPAAELDLPRGLIAVELIARWRSAADKAKAAVLFICRDEQFGEHLGANIADLAPDCPVMVFPRWDCLPFDPTGPSPEIMGRRNSVLRRLASGLAAPLVIATPEALLQRVPPRALWRDASLTVRSGDAVTPADLAGFLERVGYRLASLVDEPGEAALHGQTADIFPAGALGPVRIEFEDDRIAGLHSVDAGTQRTEGDLDAVTLDPASEFLGDRKEAAAAPSPWLSAQYQRLELVFDYLPEARVALDRGIEDRVSLWLDQIAEAHEAATRLPDIAGATARAVPSPQTLFCDNAEWRERLRRHPVETLSAAITADPRIALFALLSDPAREFRRFIGDQLAEGRRIVLTAADARELRSLARRAEPATGPLKTVATWAEALDQEQGEGVMLRVDFEAGFILADKAVTVIAAADLLGSRARHLVPMDIAPRAEARLGQSMLRLGDAVVHLDHGIARLRGIERIATPRSAPDGGEQDLLRLEFAGAASLLVPMTEIGRVWRYGGEAQTVSLDRLGGESWARRREEVQAEIAESAVALLNLAAEEGERSAAKLSPPARAYERFAAGFPFLATPDQASATDDVLSDLRAGRPMDRLICGDVGFGKTEIALRAAAAVALSGKQVAVVAPTTVLARQHLDTFRRRFAGFGVSVGHLSRLVKPAEAREVKKGLADGSIRIVVGTQAIAAKGIRFADLGLMIIDEEQRFGTATKTKLRGFADGVHVLTLTATPIPRTLQRALVGLHALSVLERPPARRLPVRTVVAQFGPARVREALLYEHRRGGQSFVVCPRIEDIEPLAAQLREIAPELRLRIAHGKMPAAEIDEAMVGFADGGGDVLLATNIIESGLDVPRANTILLWRPDRFGLAQLHQLRGRVGRGRRRGFAYLLTEPGAKLPPATEKRLQHLAEHDRLGAGFAISEEDMEMRGSGDLLGEAQAGHVRLIGIELYRHLLDRALTQAKGGEVEPDWVPELNLEIAGAIPPDYVADPEIRINLYARLARLRNAGEIDELAEEIEDRFGALPPPIENLLALARLAVEARHRFIRRIDAGPRAIALGFDPDAVDRAHLEAERIDGARWHDGRLLCEHPTSSENRIATIMDVLHALSGSRLLISGKRASF